MQYSTTEIPALGVESAGARYQSADSIHPLIPVLSLLDCIMIILHAVAPVTGFQLPLGNRTLNYQCSR